MILASLLSKRIFDFTLGDWLIVMCALLLGMAVANLVISLLERKR